MNLPQAGEAIALASRSRRLPRGSRSASCGSANSLTVSA